MITRNLSQKPLRAFCLMKDFSPKTPIHFYAETLSLFSLESKPKMLLQAKQGALSLLSKRRFEGNK
ncbi:MAG: hypothetical protein AAGI90_05320 [Chlamydiota bacterium]